MSICDAYLDASAAPEERRLWGDGVVLHRGPLSASITAVWQRPAADTLNTEGLGTDYEAREWVVSKAAYVLGGAAVDPRAGDRLIDADGTWQVLPDGDGGAAWRSDGSDWLIRTKRVA